MYSISHVAISVTDMDQSIDFYKTFGFKVVKTWQANDNSLRITHLSLNNMVIEIFCYTNHLELPNHSKLLSTDLPVIGTKHFAFGVKNIHHAYDDLLDKKVIKDNVTITTGRLGKQYFFIKDPDGILIEIIEI